MASPSIYSGGFNLTGTVFDGGADLLRLSPSYLSGTVQWVDTINGNNANSGLYPELPVQSLAQAVTNSSANGLIVIGSGSSETLGSSQSIALANLTIVGCGSGSTRPRYTCSGTVDLLAVSAAGVIIRNIYFPQSTAASTSRINFTAAAGIVRDCYFECGASDNGRAVKVHTGANNATIRGCTFLSTASRPSIGLEVSAAVTDTFVESCTFDGGSYGWLDYALKVSAAATRLTFENLSFVRRSRLGITVTATTYRMFGVTADGSDLVNITA